MICGPILKCRKWVGRSKILSEVNLNMVYGVPIYKQENFYQGALRSKFNAPFFEKCFCCGPLEGDLNYFHGNGKVPYGDHFGRGLGSGGGGPGEGGQGEGAPKLKCSDFHNFDVYGIPMGRPTTWYIFF